MPLQYSAFLGRPSVTLAPLEFAKIGETTFTVASGESSENKAIPVDGEFSLQQGDLVLVGVGSDANNFAGAGGGGILTSGYTNILAPGIFDSAAGRQLAYKFMGGVPDSVVELDQHASIMCSGVIQVFRGISQSPTLDGTVQTITGPSGMPNAPAYTVTTPGSLRVLFGVLDDDDVASSVTAPEGFINFLAADTGQASTNAGSTVMICSKIAEGAGEEDPAAFGGSGTDQWECSHFALRMAS